MDARNQANWQETVFVRHNVDVEIFRSVQRGMNYQVKCNMNTQDQTINVTDGSVNDSPIIH
jgi:hypothetical protein